MTEGEKLITPEVPKKGAPIHIIWENHDDVHEKSIAQLNKIIGENLRGKKSGNIVFFIEDGYMPLPWAEQIQDLVVSGYSPSYSFRMAQFAMEHQRFPDLEKVEEVKEMKELYDKNASFHQKRMLAVADEHFALDKRLRLLWESIPDEEFNQQMQEFERLDKAIEDTNTHLLEGNFDQALKSFKQMVEIRASTSRKRDSRLAKRISDASKEEDVIAVVGAMGASHIPFADMLTEKGHEVIRVDDAKEEFSPRDDVINIRYHSLDEEVSELQWYRGMIGGAIEDYYWEMAKEEKQEKGTITTPTAVGRYARLYLEKLPDMESIRLFEKKVKQDGFHEALTKLYEQ